MFSVMASAFSIVHEFMFVIYGFKLNKNLYEIYIPIISCAIAMSRCKNDPQGMARRLDPSKNTFWKKNKIRKCRNILF